ncbi:MAG: hypothetical protein K0U10_04410 [Gammaproteobacteria bacterium]|nr:hypothetical protein [Gammaproteobacteria bacterium]MCH9757116.1 hypothetical protein [Gammaproteobacteria bacterium]
MIEYIYKGFKLSYTVSEISCALTPSEPHTYEAHGNAIYLLNSPKWFTQTHLHAEDETHVGAEHEIKRLLENYVDFELKNFYATQANEASS